MKYENRLKLQENIIYGVVWIVVFAIPILALYLNKGESSTDTFDWNNVFAVWKETLPFFVLFLLHNYFIAPILIRKQQKTIYFTIATCLLVLFAAGQAVFNAPPRPDRMGPPPSYQPTTASEADGPDSRPAPPPQRPDGRPDPGGPGAPGDNVPPEERAGLGRMLMDNPAITNTFIVSCY